MSILVTLLAPLPFVWLGLHLAGIARRSGATPDRLLCAFFLSVGASVPLQLAAVDVSVSEGLGRASFWLTTAANVAASTAALLLACFAWKVFRPDAAWARRLIWALAAGHVVCVAAAARSLEASRSAGPEAIAQNALGAVVLLWTFLECLRYHRMLRRRVVLGLADPLLANRFLLWSLWTGAIGLQALLAAGLRIAILLSGAGDEILAGRDPGGAWLAAIALARSTLLVVAPVAAVSVWLSFSPPAAYRRWLSRSPA